MEEIYTHSNKKICFECKHSYVNMDKHVLTHTHHLNVLRCERRKLKNRTYCSVCNQSYTDICRHMVSEKHYDNENKYYEDKYNAELENEQ